MIISGFTQSHFPLQNNAYASAACIPVDNSLISIMNKKTRLKSKTLLILGYSKKTYFSNAMQFSDMSPSSLEDTPEITVLS